MHLWQCISPLVSFMNNVVCVPTSMTKRLCYTGGYVTRSLGAYRFGGGDSRRS